MPTKAKKRRRRYAAPIGGLFVALAVIGVATIIITSIRMTTRFLGNDREKEMFADLIRPVAMFNPIPFEDPQDIPMLDLLRYSLWSTVTGEKRGTYEYNDNGDQIIPASDLNRAAGRLFGPEVELVHQSFGDYDVKYYYDEETETYSVPPTAQLLYYPVVEEITKNGEYINLYVGYVAPASAWTGSEAARPEKYMIFVMEKTKESYRIAKVQDPPPEKQAGYVPPAA